MTLQMNAQPLNDAPPAVKKRKGDGAVYLVIADESAEFLKALRYAVRMAKINRGFVQIIKNIQIDDFQQWGNVEARLRKEMRERAEKSLWQAAGFVKTLSDLWPILDVEEGEITEAIMLAIKKNSDIRMLVLGGSTGGKGPGELVSYFTGKGLAKLGIPVLIVPGHLEQEQIDAIFE